MKILKNVISIYFQKMSENLQTVELFSSLIAKNTVSIVTAFKQKKNNGVAV